MNGYSEEQGAIIDVVRKFADREIRPIVEADEAQGVFRREIIAKIGELGLGGIPISSKYGGGGLGYLEYTLVLEELAAVSSAYAITLAVNGLPQIILTKFGTEEQCQKYLPCLTSGKHIGSFCLTEPGFGSDAGSIITTAKKANGKYCINGTKSFITSGGVADINIVMARTGGPGPKGISAFVVEKGTAGFTSGKHERKIGINISPTVELSFEDCEIPEANLIGKEGQGFSVSMQALDSGRITIGSIAVGIARAALEACISYSKERVQFGKPIAEFQAIQFMMADMAAGIESSRLLVQKAARLRDESKPFTDTAAMAKLVATDNAMKVTTDAVQIFGGYGCMSEYPVERLMREAKITQIVEGTNQIQRIVIARSLLK